ncbi:class I SAM-dependent methyltransferase [Leptothermofonsia sichuanensis E412]|uniref:class I SAM-dependent methyltransferase n=1 Tax=Leptothermofonsia sichuanensis TaxID=2917832 RepID=UPI001CA778D4|nr:class I SAM-dependent methyltransferase [Leptothermofonsia sichuanensis]QZZ19919.1 class I SAM-dependent methyltransferase [Leptothermofonsia sichuanensis E412]
MSNRLLNAFSYSRPEANPQELTTRCRLPSGIHAWLQELLSNLPLELHVNFWDQDFCIFGGTDQEKAGSQLFLQVHHPGVLRSLILSQDPLILVDAYLHELLDIEGDLEALIPLVQAYPHVEMQPLRSLKLWVEAHRLPPLPVDSTKLTSAETRQEMHSPDQDKASIQHHYDLGNSFYRQWLDPLMVYSCAHFEHSEMSLETAQINKIDLICRKLQLSPGQTLLDIGCGWGALLRWAVKHYGVKGYGITLSQEQWLYNQHRINQEQLSDQLTVELRDYRDLPKEPTFDKIVSVGMVEHVGLINYPIYFQSVLQVLKPGGLFLNHGIASSEPCNGSSIGERFINRYIFPNGELAQLSTMLSVAEQTGWEIVDVDAWRPHYAITLNCWADNFRRVFDRMVSLIGERKARLWQLYLRGSALAFENDYERIYQTLLRRKSDKVWNLPLTRTGWLC